MHVLYRPSEYLLYIDVKACVSVT